VNNYNFAFMPVQDHRLQFGIMSDPDVCDDDGLYFFDSDDDIPESEVTGTALHACWDYDLLQQPQEPQESHEDMVDNFLDELDDAELLGHCEPFDTYAFALRTAMSYKEAEDLQPYLAWRPLEVIRKTIEHTTSLAQVEHHLPMKRHRQARFPYLNRKRLTETVSTDTAFMHVPALGGSTCAQVFFGLYSHFVNVYGMQK
jgi:hypothetical protein